MSAALDLQDAAGGGYRLAEAIAARLDEEGGHWLWRGPVDAKGYPRLRIAGRDRLVARLVVEIEGRTIAPGLVVAYCDADRACLHPDHLDVMTRRDRLFASAADGASRRTSTPRLPTVTAAAGRSSWSSETAASAASTAARPARQRRHVLDVGTLPGHNGGSPTSGSARGSPARRSSSRSGPTTFSAPTPVASGAIASGAPRDERAATRATRRGSRPPGGHARRGRRSRPGAPA